MDKSNKKPMRLWAFALLIASITFMTLTRQDDLQSFRPVHLASVFACGLVIGAALVRTVMYYRHESKS